MAPASPARSVALGAVEGPVVVRIRALMAPASPARSVALRRLRCQSLICLPIACFALGLMAGEKLTKKASSATGQATPEGVAEKVEAGVLRLITAVRVFAVHDLRLVGMQLKAQGPEPLNEAGAELSGLLLGVAVDDHIIRVTLERTAGVFAVHPLVERIVHEEVREQRRDRRSLWGSHLSWRGGSVSHRHGGFEPPLDVEQHPTLVGVVSDRPHEQIMANAVEEGPDIEIEHPVLAPTTLASHGQRVVGASPRPVPVAVGAQDRLKLLFPQHRCRGLSHPVCHIRHTENPDPGPMILRYLNGSHRPGGNSSPKTSDSTACRGCPPRRPRNRRCSQRPRPALHCSLGPSPTPQKRDASNFKRLQLLPRSICRLLPRRVDLQTTLNCPTPSPRTPLQGPHRYYGPVRPCAPHRYSRTRSVCCLWFSPSRPKTLAVSIGATGSPVPCQRLR